MIVLRRSFLIGCAVCVGLIMLGLGFYGYRSLIDTALAAERFFFVSLVAAVVVFVVLLVAVLRAEILDRRLDRLIAQGTRRDIVPGRDFAALGTLGEKLGVIYDLISRQNVLKTRKISALHDLVDFLVRNLDRPLAVCDAAGILRYANEEWADSVKMSRIDVIGEDVGEIIQDLSMTTLTSTLLQTRQPVGGQVENREYTCYPIEDRSNELAYMVFLIGGKAKFFEKRDRDAGASTKRPAWVANFNRFLNRPKK